MKYKNNDTTNLVFKLFLKLFGKDYTKKLWGKEINSFTARSSRCAYCGYYRIFTDYELSFLEFTTESEYRFCFNGDRILNMLEPCLVDHIISREDDKVLEDIALVCSPLSKIIYENLNKESLKNIDINIQCKFDNIDSLLVVYFHTTKRTMICLKIDIRRDRTYISVLRLSFGRITTLLEDYSADESTCIDAARILNDNLSKRLS